MPEIRQAHRALGMSDGEYDTVVGLLERPPEAAELAMFSAMWSEHCSYKSSRTHLRRLPTKAPWVVLGPGQNAGVVDLGDGWFAALRIESHNHPSFVEPHQGAATGVGGIIRDILAVGARPIGVWDQIRFGSLDDSHSRYLFEGTVTGIAGYGNAVGVPTVGGEVAFGDCYRQNPLVNVMALGLLRPDDLVLAEAGADGNAAILLGSGTGRDGIGGASTLASAPFGRDEHTMRPFVQVGDPFSEKKLIEACLELCHMGLLEGLQDLGAAGLACATSESAARSGRGIDLDLDAVHVREPDLSAADLLVSESQERLLAFTAPRNVQAVTDVADRWEVDSSVIGEVRRGSALRAYRHGNLVANVQALSLSHGPTYERPRRQPDWLADLRADEPPQDRPDISEAVLSLLDDPSLADKSWVYTQYDHQLFLNTIVEPGHDGSLLRVKGTDKGLAVSTDGNGALCQLDPRLGAARLVYEAALNVAVVGAVPLALVDNLNLGSPEDPEVMWQLIETIEGISEACEALRIPVVGGNVSFYNETDGMAIFPTPVVGVLGLADPMPTRPPRLDRAESGMELWLLGPEDGNLAGSSYARVRYGQLGGHPTPVDPNLGRAVTRAAATMASEEIVPVLHDVSDGGLAIALAEICARSGVGAVVAYRDWRGLFSEGPHRVLAGLRPDQVERATEIALTGGLPARRVGHFAGDSLVFVGGDGGDAVVPLTEATRVWREAIPRRLV